MEYKNFTTFKVDIDNGIAWVTFDFPPVNVQGQEMLADLSSLALRLERDRTVKVVVFQSANLTSGSVTTTLTCCEICQNKRFHATKRSC